MNRSFLRRVWQRLFRGGTSVPPGKANLSAFEPVIGTYRKRGSRIGEKVRLLGRIDGINPHLVSIGDYSVIGAGSALLAHCPIGGAAPCRVGRFVYIGYGAIILPGVTLGDGCVVGAGSVVTRDVPEGSIVAGNPARVIRQLTQDERERIQKTMQEGRLFGWDDEQGARP